MIPRHRPPFGVAQLAAALLRPSPTPSVQEIEEACAAACNVRHAVLLPSARAGICWGLRATLPQGSPVLVPALTCRAVHEAVARSGRQFTFVDAKPGSFLMDPALVSDPALNPGAVVQSELYGLGYTGNPIAPAGNRCVVIVDAAMTIPTPLVFARLRDGDIGVISFGVGKCMYAGWGGAAVTRSPGVARALRTQREAHLAGGGAMLGLSRAAHLAVRTLVHERGLYGAFHRLRQPPDHFASLPDAWLSDAELSLEWRAPSTAADRRVIQWNFERAAQAVERRISLASSYRERLSGTARVALPGSTPFAMSHYSIRVPAADRGAIRASLRRAGIDTARLFRFPGYLSESEFPNAAAAAAEVINLPLHDQLTEGDIARICDHVCTAVSATCLDYRTIEEYGPLVRPGACVNRPSVNQ